MNIFLTEKSVGLTETGNKKINKYRKMLSSDCFELERKIRARKFHWLLTAAQSRIG